MKINWTRILSFKSGALRVGHVAIFLWATCGLIALLAFNAGIFSDLFRLWLHSARFDYSRLVMAIGIAFFTTGIFLWVAWELMPASWKDRLERRYPSKGGRPA